MDNEILRKISDEQEVWITLRSVGAIKAPGPDGITTLLYKTYWSIVKTDMVDVVKRFFTSRYFLRALNHKNLVLIPKTENLTLVSHFQPISLCNILYKIISQILASCLKIFLPKLISPMQTGFVPNRLIQENPILAHELIHHFKHKDERGVW